MQDGAGKGRGAGGGGSGWSGRAPGHGRSPVSTGPGSLDTDGSLFQPDLDPLTLTDPADPDSDMDGMTDGQEDANVNGVLDPGETDPIAYLVRRSKRPLRQQHALYDIHPGGC